jgi:hypothetical protein
MKGVYLLRSHVRLVLLQRLLDVCRHEEVLDEDVVGHDLLHGLAEAGRQQPPVQLDHLGLLLVRVNDADLDVGLKAGSTS